MRGSERFDFMRESRSIGSKAQGESSLGRRDVTFPGQKGGWLKCELSGRMEG